MAGQQHFEKIEKVEKLSSAENSGSLDTGVEEQLRQTPNKDKFDNLMSVGKVDDGVATRRVESKSVSLADEIATVGRRADQAQRASPQLFVAQAQEVLGKIKELKDKLNTPNLELKGSVQNVMQNKLSHIDESLKIALSKAGVEYQAPTAVTTEANRSPIERFLGFLTDSQHRIETLSSEVYSAHLNNREISPATMLAMQVKVGFVQQELEFFTGMLNKALESTKTLMNVQV